MRPLLIAWDFSGVIDFFGTEAAPLLLRLQAHGAEQIVASSSMAGTIEQYLKQQQMDTYFSQVYGLTPKTLQWVGDSATMKEDLLHHHLRKFGPYQKIVVIGDSESDIRAGKEVKAETILFSRGNLNFETSADHVVYSLQQLSQQLLPEKKN
jgi:phosphoglycolate phosphatase-like HAD superfamily hydrolase